MLWLYLITTNIFPFYILVSFLSFLNLILSNYFVLSHIQVVLRMVNIPKTVINSLLKKTLYNSRFREEEKTRGFFALAKRNRRRLQNLERAITRQFLKGSCFSTRLKGGVKIVFSPEALSPSKKKKNQILDFKFFVFGLCVSEVRVFGFELRLGPFRFHF